MYLTLAAAAVAAAALAATAVAILMLTFECMQGVETPQTAPHQVPNGPSGLVSLQQQQQQTPGET